MSNYKENNYGLDRVSDKEVIEKILRGNQELFGVIIKRYEKSVAGTVKGMLGDCPEAEEVGQDTFIRCFQSLDRFRGESSLKTYLIRIAMNLSLNEIKKRKRTMKRMSRLENSHQNTERSEDTIHKQNEIKDLIQNALIRLEPRQRSVLILRIIEGYSTKETSKILGIPVGTVLSRLSRAMENMRTIIGSQWNKQ